LFDLLFKKESVEELSLRHGKLERQLVLSLQCLVRAASLTGGRKFRLDLALEFLELLEDVQCLISLQKLLAVRGLGQLLFLGPQPSVQIFD